MRDRDLKKTNMPLIKNIGSHKRKNSELTSSWEGSLNGEEEGES